VREDEATGEWVVSVSVARAGYEVPVWVFNADLGAVRVAPAGLEETTLPARAGDRLCVAEAVEGRLSLAACETVRVR